MWPFNDHSTNTALYIVFACIKFVGAFTFPNQIKCNYFTVDGNFRQNVKQFSIVFSQLQYFYDALQHCVYPQHSEFKLQTVASLGASVGLSVSRSVCWSVGRRVGH